MLDVVLQKCPVRHKRRLHHEKVGRLSILTVHMLSVCDVPAYLRESESFPPTDHGGDDEIQVPLDVLKQDL